MPSHLERDGTTSRNLSNATVTRFERDVLAVGHDGARNKTPVIALGQTQPTKQSNKRSWDYILKTGAAGGLAGCVVGSQWAKQIHQRADQY